MSSISYITIKESNPYKHGIVLLTRKKSTNNPEIPHSAPCHKFQKQLIPCLSCLENDLINGVFCDSVPSNQAGAPKKLFHHGCITGILKVLIDIIPDEIEKGRKMGMSSAFGLLFCFFGYPVQKRQDLIRSYFPDIHCTRIKLMQNCRINCARVSSGGD